MHDDLLRSAVRAEGFRAGVIDLECGAAGSALKVYDSGRSCELGVHIAAGETLLAIKIVLEDSHGFTLILSHTIG